MTDNKYLVPMAKVTCNTCGSWELFQRGDPDRGRCRCYMARFNKKVFEEVIDTGEGYKCVAATVERVEVDFSKQMAPNTRHGYVLAEAWDDNEARAAFISRFARTVYERQLRDRARDNLDGKGCDYLWWPATKEAVAYLRENYGDDDLVDWKVEHNGAYDVVSITACGSVFTFHLAEEDAFGGYSTSHYAERISNVRCGNCPACRAEADRDAHDAAGEKVQKEYASMFLRTGGRGVGKSTAAEWFARETGASIVRRDAAGGCTYCGGDCSDENTCRDDLIRCGEEESEKLEAAEKRAMHQEEEITKVARYDLERACQCYGCQLWPIEGSETSGVVDGAAVAITKNGKARMTWVAECKNMVRNGESVDDMVRAWVEGVK